MNSGCGETSTAEFADAGGQGKLVDSALGRGSDAIGPVPESAAAVAVSAAAAGIDTVDLRRRDDIDRGSGLDGSAPSSGDGSGFCTPLLLLAASRGVATVAAADDGADVATSAGGTDCSSAKGLGTAALRAMRKANAFLGLLPPLLPPPPFSASEIEWDHEMKTGQPGASE